MEHNHHHFNDNGDNGVDLSAPITRIIITILLNFLIAFVEVIGGLLSHSLSLLSDAFHNLNDAIAIIISYIALRLGRKPKSYRNTFGLKRAEILAAVFNAGTMMVICIFLIKEAYMRFISPKPIRGGMMIIIAVIGLVANIIGTWLLKKDSKENLNIRSAYIHLLGDTVSSVAVIAGGIFIITLNIYWIDPLLTILISLYILYESYGILKEAIDILMMRTPEYISMKEIKKEIENVSQIKNIHHVHIWRLDEKNIHFEAHVEVSDMRVSETESILKRIEERLQDNFGITHITLQFETDKCSNKELV